MPLKISNLKKAYVKPKTRIIKFFLDNPNPTDEQIHSLAEEMKVPYAKLEELIYSMFTTIVNSLKGSNMISAKLIEKAYNENNNNVDLFVDALHSYLKKLSPDLEYEVKHAPNLTSVNFSGSNLKDYFRFQVERAAKYAQIPVNYFNIVRRGKMIVVTIKH